jgi:uncharacterized protein YjbI with pentapeptide repeats
VTSLDLRADCARCFALCCVALPFARSADFPVDKPAGRACGHLQADFRCGIHDRLRPEGFAGCTAFDCFGAGQRVAQVTFAGRDWRAHPELAPAMFDAFATMRQLHEMVWYLRAALTWTAAEPIRADLRGALDATESLAEDVLTRPDVATHRARVAPLLRRASALVRGARGPDHAGRDFAGADLRERDLRDADLRGACLIAADLRGVDLGRADLLGADLRNADLRGADLAGALFLTRQQVAAARRDDATRLPPNLR